MKDWFVAVWPELIQGLAWLLAALWVWRTSDLVRRLPEVVDLNSEDWNIGPAQLPSLAVIVPAKDEAANLPATLDALAVQSYPRLRVIVVDDRSMDETGRIAEDYAARFSQLIEALHITELPEGWLGKTWALEAATQQCRDVDYLLFTDADVLISPSTLLRALAYAEAAKIDHLVVLPTPLVKSRGEGIVLGFCQLLGPWISRPWKVSDPKAKRDMTGIGAFNFVRRETFEEIGGWLPQRMVVLEDVTLGRRMKAAGMRQRVAFAPHSVLVHWAAGMRGVIRVMTKNVFSAVNFHSTFLLGGVVWIALVCLLPLAGLFYPPTMIPCLLVMLSIAVSYRELGRVSAIDARYGWLYPVGALALIFAMLRSMVVVLWQRGVIWRGTFYPIRQLRRYNSPFVWQREADEMRYRQRREAPSRLRRWVDRIKSR